MIRSVFIVCIVAMVTAAPKVKHTKTKVHTEVHVDKHDKDAHGEYGVHHPVHTSSHVYSPAHHDTHVHTHQVGYAHHGNHVHGGHIHGHQHGGLTHGKHHGGHHYGPAKYAFSYGIHDDYHGSNFGHSESRDGHITKGMYYVHLPDGRLQKVSYYVDKYGYHPTITYEGKAHFPVHKPHHVHGKSHY